MYVCVCSLQLVACVCRGRNVLVRLVGMFLENTVPSHRSYVGMDCVCTYVPGTYVLVQLHNPDTYIQLYEYIHVCMHSFCFFCSLYRIEWHSIAWHSITSHSIEQHRRKGDVYTCKCKGPSPPSFLTLPNPNFTLLPYYYLITLLPYRPEGTEQQYIYVLYIHSSTKK